MSLGLTAVAQAKESMSEEGAHTAVIAEANLGVEIGRGVAVQLRISQNIVKLRNHTESLRRQSHNQENSFRILSLDSTYNRTRLVDSDALTLAMRSIKVARLSSQEGSIAGPQVQVSKQDGGPNEDEACCHINLIIPSKRIRKLARALRVESIVEEDGVACCGKWKSIVVFASTLVKKGKPITLDRVQNVPKYKTWIHIDRNELMDNPIEHSPTDSILKKLEEPGLKSLMDTYDRLFCRFCLRFDCSKHGTSRPRIEPREKLDPWVYPVRDQQACGVACHLHMDTSAENRSDLNYVTLTGWQSNSSDTTVVVDTLPKAKVVEHMGVNESVCLDDSFHIRHLAAIKTYTSSEIARRVYVETSTLIQIGTSGGINSLDYAESGFGSEETSALETDVSQRRNNKLEIHDAGRSCKSTAEVTGDERFDAPQVSKQSCEDLAKAKKSWSAVEIELCQAGVDIFGTHFCLTAKHLLKGSRTCTEIANFVSSMGNQADTIIIEKESATNACSRKPRRFKRIGLKRNAPGDRKPSQQESHNKVTDHLHYTDSQNRRHDRYLEVKLICIPGNWWNASGRGSVDFKHHPLRQDDRPGPIQNELEMYKQYEPCSCRSMCGETCPCATRGIHCEKYCGCLKGCKLRFPGCSCRKGFCNNLVCPCLAEDRECDPDVCKGCWVDCGDSSLEAPPKRPAGKHLCNNMMMLGGTHKQKLLLGRSDIEGWGLFTRDALQPKEFVGEYIGELISIEEAENRAEENIKFLFDMNDTYVIDPLRRGNKMKFANHSWKPNCKAQIMMVGADYRVGIYAKTNIDAGSELFFSYYADLASAPKWAKRIFLRTRKMNNSVLDSNHNT